MREKPVTIEVRKDGKYWAVYAEEQLITLTVYEKGAQMLDSLLHGLLRYSSRKFFRLALSEAMKGPKPAKAAKTPKAEKKKSNPNKAKGTKQKISVTDEGTAMPPSEPVSVEIVSSTPVSATAGN